MPKPFQIPATGTINYKFILVKTNFPEDMWIKAAEMRPGNPKVLHHGKVWVRPPGSHWLENAVPGEAYENETQRNIIGRNGAEEGNDILGKFNPGLGAQSFDVDGSAKFVPKGSDLVFEIALHDYGATDRGCVQGRTGAGEESAAVALLLQCRTDRVESRDSSRRRKCRSRQRGDA